MGKDDKLRKARSSQQGPQKSKGRKLCGKETLELLAEGLLREGIQIHAAGTGPNADLQAVVLQIDERKVASVRVHVEVVRSTKCWTSSGTCPGCRW